MIRETYIEYLKAHLVESDEPIKFCEDHWANYTYRGVSCILESNKDETGFRKVRYTRYSKKIDEKIVKANKLKDNFYYTGESGLNIIGIGYIHDYKRGKYSKLYKYMERIYKLCFPNELTKDEYESLVLKINSNEIRQQIHKHNIDLKNMYFEAFKTLNIHKIDLDEYDYSDFHKYVLKWSVQDDITGKPYTLFFTPKVGLYIKIEECLKNKIKDIDGALHIVGYSFVVDNKPKAILLASIIKKSTLTKSNRLIVPIVMDIEELLEPTLMESTMLKGIKDITIHDIESLPLEYKYIVCKIISAEYKKPVESITYSDCRELIDRKAGMRLMEQLGFKYAEHMIDNFMDIENLDYTIYKGVNFDDIS